MMFCSSRRGTSTRKQTSFARTYSSKVEDGNRSGNETDCGSAELLHDISTSREDLSPSRCSCLSGGSGNVAARSEVKEGGSECVWSGNLRLEFDNNGASEEEQLKEELLRIFDRERLGLESYFKQKTENVLQGYRRKQYEMEEKLRLERMESEKILAQEKIEVQQNYINEMTNLTKQFNQERIELESHYKKQIEELSQQFEIRKKEMDVIITKERTELKQRLQAEYEAMLKSQRVADEQRCRQQITEVEESHKKKILELEQKLKDSLSEGELSGRRLQSDLEAKFEYEKSQVVMEWRKRLELLEMELGKEKERASKEERKACESRGFLRNEISKKDLELEKLRQVIETLKLELSHKEKAAEEYEMLQQNIFLRGRDALPGKLREDFEKMLATHREQLEKNLRDERDEVENEREKRLVLERETMEKQLKVEQERMKLELEEERSEMRQVTREKEEKLREEVKEEMESIRKALETEKELLKEQVRAELMKERNEIGEKFLKEKEARDAEIGRQLKKSLEEEQQKNGRKHGLMTTPRGRKSKTEKDKMVYLEDDDKIRIQTTKARDGKHGEDGLGQNNVRFEAEEAERRRNDLGRDEYEMWLAGQKMEHTKQWVQGQYRFSVDNHVYSQDSAADNNDLEKNSNVGRCDEDGSKNDGRVVNKERNGQGCMHGKAIAQHALREDNRGYFKGDLSAKNGSVNKLVGRHGRCNVDNECSSNREELRMIKQCGGETDLKSIEYMDEEAGKQDERHKSTIDPCENYSIAFKMNPESTLNNPDRNLEYSIRNMKAENEGLKAKLTALEENVELHECFKKEASEEVERLRKTNKSLKMKVEELENTTKEYDGIKNTLKDFKGLKETLQKYEQQLKDNEGQLKSNEEKIREYEDICAEYERTLQECRQTIMVIEQDRQSSTVVPNMSSDISKRQVVSKVAKEAHNSEYYIGSINRHVEMRQMVKILDDEKERLEEVVKSLQEKVKLLETKILEITIADKQANSCCEEKMKLTSDLNRVRRQNQGLVNKIKNLQCQLQETVDKLQKKKKKIANLKDEKHSLKSCYQNEISDLQRKLDYSSEVITRLQHESNRESSTIERLQNEVANMTKMVMEEQVSKQSILRARSIEEIERLRDLDTEKAGLERKLLDARAALDGYCERLQHRMSNSELASSQLSLNVVSNESKRLSKTLQVLEETQKTSREQNQRLKQEKQELQTLIGRFCKSQEDLRSITGSRELNACRDSKISLSSRSSSMSSLSSSCVSLALVEGGRESGLGSTKFSSTFSIFD